MKQILIALALIACCSAEAQTTVTTETKQKTTKTKTGEAYVVCSEEGGYYNCCVHHRKVVKTTTKKKSVVASTHVAAVAAKPAAAPVHKVAVKHRRPHPVHPVAALPSGNGGACRMVPYQVCKINPDRRSVTCYPTTDPDGLTPSGPGTTYGSTGPMPGEVVHFKVKTIVIKGEDKGAYCRRNKENTGTICTQPGLIVRDARGYYSYGEPSSHRVVSNVVVVK